MTLIFNMDIGNSNKTTSYGIDRKEDTFPTIYFRLYKNRYGVDMKDFNKLSLRIQELSNGTTYTVTTSKVTVINGEKLVEVKLDDKYLNKSDTLIIKPTITYLNTNKGLDEFKLIIYEGSKTEMNLVKQGVVRFNQVYNLFIKAIKRDQINKPNGVIGLDGDARMNIKQLPDVVGQHVHTKVRDTDIHGLRLNDKFMLEVYDKDDEYWWEANVLHGGFFGFPNKLEKYNVFGGYWGELIPPVITDGGIFTEEITDVYDGGLFTDITDTLPPLHAGKF